jgi:cytochrome c biogenesis protein
LILVGIASAVGTVILQRPLTEAEDLARAYRPETLAWLDRLGLTDVFHAGWFVALLALLSINIILASLERLPLAWRYVTRPYRRPEPHFLAGLPLQKEIAVRSESVGVDAAERAFRHLGLKPQRVGSEEPFGHEPQGKQGLASISLYAEKNRFARLAAYVVHASLLMIFAGGIADAVWGYRGFVAMTRGEQVDTIKLNDGTQKAIGFTVRCDAAGQENYPDGTPKRWWSKLTVIEDGREVSHKDIEVNDPLVHRGLRFFQSSYGSTGQMDGLTLLAKSKTDPARATEIHLHPNQVLPLDPQTTVQLTAFVPDFVLVGNRIESRSDQLNNPAIQLLVNSPAATAPFGREPQGKQGAATPVSAKVWLFPNFPGFAHPDESPYTFELRDIEMGYFTGLQVAYEPGQWLVWAGVILMGLGLVMAFYFVHVRYWAVPVNDGRGRMTLWIGASASKNRDEFEEGFQKLVHEIEEELGKRESVSPAVASNASAAVQN